ncbi:MAG: polymer-forming cytoskeletal protein [Saprospiraceae bacterium]|nr:polymer-forming cytoskeletal protein [Saprospiraceae bacterium]
MFNSKKDNITPTTSTSTPPSRPTSPASPSRSTDSSLNIIGKETEIEGTIKCRGNIRIDGHLKGTITSEGKLVVSDTGSVEGDIFCKDADFAGNITGNIKARGKVTIKPKAFIKGDVRYHDLEIEPGAHIACTISRMNPDKKEEALPAPSASVKKTVTPEKELPTPKAV